MPFKSPRQRRYLYAKHPKIARRWSAEEKAVSKMDPRYGAGGGSHGSRIVEKAERTEPQRRRRNAAIGAGVGTAVGHQAISGGMATHGVNNFLRSEAPHLSKPARYAASGALGTAAAWHPGTLLSAARTPKYLALLAPGAVAGGLIGHSRKKKVAKADKIGEIHRAAKARRSLSQAFGDEVLMPAAHKVMGPKYVKPGKGKLNAEERRQQGLWMAQGYPVNKADIAKSRREYDPEHRRQRRLGIAEAALVGGGGTAAGFGGHGAYSDTKKLRRAKVFNGVGAKHSVLSQTPIGRGALSINRKNALLLGGGLLGLGAAGAVRAHAEKPKGRPWD